MVKFIPKPSRMERANYAIRDVVLEAKKVEESGKKVIYLNSGDPLKHGFDIPPELKEAMCEAVKSHNHYGDPTGEETTKEAIAERERKFNHISIDPSNIVVGNGVSEVFLLISAAVFDEGSEVLVPGPTYPIYKTYPEFMGAKAVEYACDEEEGWAPNVEDIRKKINERTVGIVLVNPNNPTGALYSSRKVKEIIDVAAEHELLVFSDEIYDHNIIEGEFKSTSSLTDYPVIGLNGISKSFFATGWRLGYCYLHNPSERELELFERVKKVARMRAYTNTPVQKAAEKLMLKEPFLLKEAMKRIRKSRDYVVKRIREIEMLEVEEPKAAFYAFPRINMEVDDKEFVRQLLWEKGILFVHGSGFGSYGKGHFRIVYLGKEEELVAAMDGLYDFCREHFGNPR